MPSQVEIYHSINTGRTSFVDTSSKNKYFNRYLQLQLGGPTKGKFVRPKAILYKRCGIP